MQIGAYLNTLGKNGNKATRDSERKSHCRAFMPIGKSHTHSNEKKKWEIWIINEKNPARKSKWENRLENCDTFHSQQEYESTFCWSYQVRSRAHAHAINIVFHLHKCSTPILCIRMETYYFFIKIRTVFLLFSFILSLSLFQPVCLGLDLLLRKCY